MAAHDVFRVAYACGMSDGLIVGLFAGASVVYIAKGVAEWVAWMSSGKRP